MNRIVVTPQAEQDIRAIYRRIRREAPEAAARWSKGIRAHIKTLARFPERSPLAPESETFDLMNRSANCSTAKETGEPTGFFLPF